MKCTYIYFTHYYLVLNLLYLTGEFIHDEDIPHIMLKVKPWIWHIVWPSVAVWLLTYSLRNTRWQCWLHCVKNKSLNHDVVCYVKGAAFKQMWFGYFRRYFCSFCVLLFNWRAEEEGGRGRKEGSGCRAQRQCWFRHRSGRLLSEQPGCINTVTAQHVPKLSGSRLSDHRRVWISRQASAAGFTGEGGRAGGGPGVWQIPRLKFKWAQHR